MKKEVQTNTSNQGEMKRYTTCTTAGPMFVYVKDGKIIRIEPMWFSQNEVKPWKIEVNGKTYTPPLNYPLLYWGTSARQWVYSPNRVNYPYKRVDWNPNGERHPENRGKSGYVRISWDEAIDILTSEIKRVQETYGPSALSGHLCAHCEWGSFHYFFSDFFRFTNIIGNTWRFGTPQSWEGWISGAGFMYGYIPQMGILPAEDTLQDISKDSELIVLWGNDIITKTMYMGIDTSRPFVFWRELGKKVVVIEPYFNDTGAAFADKWIPIIPGTDAALAAAIAYLWITKGTYDKEYVDTHTVGFDEEHLPQGAPAEHSFKSFLLTTTEGIPKAPAGYSFKNYILGISDGIPKTPQWAEQITGVPSRIINELANEWASKPTSSFCMHGGACRRAYAHEWSRFMVALQAMQGLGKPGVNMIGSFTNLCGPYDKRQVGPFGYADGGVNIVANKAYTGGLLLDFDGTSKYKNPVIQHAVENLIDKIVLNPPQKWRGGQVINRGPIDLWAEHEYPAKGCSEIKMVWARGGSGENYPDINNREIRTYQSPKIETVVIQSPMFDRDCRLADLVLPVTTNFERQDMTEPGKAGEFIPPSVVNQRCAIYHQQCIPPVGESKSDYEILSLVAEKLGVNDKYNEGNNQEGWLRKFFAKTNIPMSFEEFKEKGYYVWPFLEDYKPCKQMQPFYENPEKNPLFTPSGKIEIFSQVIYKEWGADNPEIPPIPHYIPEWEGRYDKPMLEKYPLQLLTPHPKFRYHGKYNDAGWLSEIYKVKGPDGYQYEPVVMNIEDAKARGLKKGDIVRVFNDRGQILCGVVISKRITSGVVRIAYGSWWDMLEMNPGAIDRGGNANMLTTTKPVSVHHLGLAVNSCLVEIEKADLETLAKQYPEGWAGKYRSWSKE